MRAYNNKGRNKNFGRYDGIKAIIDSNIKFFKGDFRHDDVYLENYKRGSFFGQPLSIEGVSEWSIRNYFGGYRKLWRIHHESSNWKVLNCVNEDGLTIFAKKDDIKDVIFNTFYILRRGGVFNAKTGVFFKKRIFEKAYNRYKSQGKKGVEVFEHILENTFNECY